MTHPNDLEKIEEQLYSVQEKMEELHARTEGLTQRLWEMEMVKSLRIERWEDFCFAREVLENLTGAIEDNWNYIQRALNIVTQIESEAKA